MHARLAPLLDGVAVTPWQLVTVWDGLVGQRAVIERLQRAVAGDMTHAWLFTGPPGLGPVQHRDRVRGGAAVRAGRVRRSATPATRSRSAPTPTYGSPAPRSSRSASTRCASWSAASALAPVGRRWQVMVVEDADRLTDQAANALLKAIEEPTERTVWLLCAPTVEDVLPTIRSRTRLVVLVHAVGRGRDRLPGPRPTGSRVETASYAARASQGHIGRARALARDEDTRRRRREVVAIPARLTSLGACMAAAADLHDLAKEEAEALTERARPAREGRPRPGLRGRRARPAAARVRPRPA